MWAYAGIAGGSEGRATGSEMQNSLQKLAAQRQEEKHEKHFATGDPGIATAAVHALA